MYKKNVLIHLAVLSIALLLTCCNPQTARQKISSSQQVRNEALSEWFLSTGDWYGDPKLYARTVGTGPDTVVMLHGGWGGEHRYLISATQGLEDKYCFVLYDQRGSLRSPFPDSLITFENHIADLDRVRKDLGLKSMKLVGHSMGAVLACAYQDKYPENVKNLTLISPAQLKSPTPEEDHGLMQESATKVQAFLARPQVSEEMAKFSLNRQSPPLSSREETAKFRISFASRFLFDVSKWKEIKEGGPFYNPRVDYLTSQTMPSSGWDYPRNFKESKIPVSIILGDHDFIDMGGAVISKWTRGIPNVNVSLIKQAAHDTWIDQPDEFRKQFEAALKR